MHIPTFHRVVEVTTSTVTIASFICNILPKSTVFADYPRVKKAYETTINFIILVALNWRQCLPSLGLHIPGLGFAPPESENSNSVSVGPILK